MTTSPERRVVCYSCCKAMNTVVTHNNRMFLLLPITDLYNMMNSLFLPWPISLLHVNMMAFHKITEKYVKFSTCFHIYSQAFQRWETFCNRFTHNRIHFSPTSSDCCVFLCIDVANRFSWDNIINTHVRPSSTLTDFNGMTSCGWQETDHIPLLVLIVSFSSFNRFCKWAWSVTALITKWLLLWQQKFISFCCNLSTNYYRPFLWGALEMYSYVFNQFVAGVGWYSPQLTLKFVLLVVFAFKTIVKR